MTDKSASTKLASGVVLKSEINQIAIRKEIKLQNMASKTSEKRKTRRRTPNTRCVLMLLMRIGESAVLKLVKLIAAMAIITKAMASKINRVCRLAFGVVSNCTSVVKCISFKAVRRKFVFVYHLISCPPKLLL